MSKIPPVRRLVTEDFQDQKKWIGKLFQPLNNFMESVVSVLNHDLTFADNISGAIIEVTFNSLPTATAPLPLAWTLPHAPVALVVGNAVRTDGTAEAFTAAVQIQWTFGNKGLQVTNLMGVTPTNNKKYTLTLLAFTG